MTPDEILKILRETFYTLNRAAIQPSQRDRDKFMRDFFQGLAKIGVTPIEVLEAIDEKRFIALANPPAPVIPRKRPVEPGSEELHDLLMSDLPPAYTAKDVDSLVLLAEKNGPVLDDIARVIKASGWNGVHSKLNKPAADVLDLIDKLSHMKGDRIRDLPSTTTRPGQGGSMQALTRLIIRSWHDWYVSQGKPAIWTSTSSSSQTSRSPASTSETGSISSASH